MTNINIPANVHDLPELRNTEHVYAGREEAGVVLADMLADLAKESPIVLAIPAGGVPVAAVVAQRLKAPLSLLITSKATPSWNTEVGFAAVAFDGSEMINQESVKRLGLTPEEVREGLRQAHEKVSNRWLRFLGERGLPEVRGRTVILVDDGLASGFTMMVAIKALESKGADTIIVAVPTAHLHSVLKIAPLVEQLYCPNIRGGWIYAVADAYQHWHDVSEDEVEEILGSRCSS